MGLDMMMNKKENKLTQLEQNILLWVDWRGEKTAKDVSRFFEIDISDANEILKKLKGLNYINSTNERPAKYYSLRGN